MGTLDVENVELEFVPGGIRLVCANRKCDDRIIGEWGGNGVSDYTLADLVIEAEGHHCK